MSFIWPLGLAGLLLLPLLVWLYLRGLQARRLAALELGPLGSLEDQSGRKVGARRHIPPGLMLIGIGMLAVSFARPQMMVSLPHVEGTVILAFDVSNSMSADDLEPSRLEAAKVAARSFVESQPPAIRIGVVGFGGSGLIVQAPTDDQAAVLEAIDRLRPQGGTSLGEGIFVSLNAIAGEALSIEQASEGDGVDALRIEDYSSAVLLLLSDGENNEAPDPREIAQLAAEAGVRIYTIGVGTPDGTVIEVEGFHVVTQLDEVMLEDIASVTNGRYYRADDEQDLQTIYEQVDLQLTTRGEQMEVTALLAGSSTLLLVCAAYLSLLWFGRVP